MGVLLQKSSAGTTPIELVTPADFDRLTGTLDAPSRAWMKANGFTGAPDSHVLVPGADGRVAAVWAGVRGVGHPFGLGALPAALPETPGGTP